MNALPHRVVEGLDLVALLPGRPKYIPLARGLRGSKAAGLAYEKKVGRKLRRLWPDLVSGQWFEYSDANGVGCCQVDHYVVLDYQVVVFECKLSQTPVGFSQIDLLYRPILEMVYGKPVTGVQVCKHLREIDPRIVSKVQSALAAPGCNFLWHCLA